MPAKPANKKKKKKSNVKSRSLQKQNPLKNKKIAGVLIALVAVVGVVTLVRTFAATTVVSLNPADGLGPAAIPGLSTNENVSVVEKTSTDGKKQTQKRVAQMTYSTANPYGEYNGEIIYSTQLNEGYYKFCTTLKPTVTQSFAYISTMTSNRTGEGAHMHAIEASNPNAPQYSNGGRGIVKLNEQKELCVVDHISITEAEENIEFAVGALSAAFDDDNASENSAWNVYNMKIQAVSREEVTSSALVSAARFGSTQIPPSDTLTFYGDKNIPIKVVKDTVNETQRDVIELTDHTLSMYRMNFPEGIVDSTKYKYKLCVLTKAIGISSNNEYTISSNGPTGGAGPSITMAASQIDNNYNKKCSPDLVIGQIGGGVGGSFYPQKGAGNESVWRVADAWIERIPL